MIALMNRPVDESLVATHPTTVLDRVRPTVVVRRRVYEVPQAAQNQRSLVMHVTHTDEGDEDDNGPPSSVNVARALASLRVDELRRVEAIVSADDDPVVPSVPPVPPPVAVPTVRVGLTIAIADLGRAMNVSTQELVTALVTRGFFSVTVKTVLPRETARTAAAMFGWEIEEHEEVTSLTPKLKATPTRKGTSPKTKVKAGARASSKAKLAKKPTTRRHG